jgi:hypothetical protein
MLLLLLLPVNRWGTWINHAKLPGWFRDDGCPVEVESAQFQVSHSNVLCIYPYESYILMLKIANLL